ncbi:MAG: PEGA domain-containing protein [Vicinamibacterales bacterium]
MESQTEIVAAAEAVRTWVRTQRASWTADEVALLPPPVVLRPSPPQAVLPLPAPLRPPVPVVPPPPAPVSGPPAIPAPVPAPADVPGTAWSNPSTSREPVAEWPVAEWPVASQQTSGAMVIVAETSRVGRAWFRAALAALLILSVAGGYLVLSRRSATAVGAAAFHSTPPGAEVFVDGAPVGRTPVRVELKAGTHSVEFKLKAATRTQTIAVKRGSEVPVTVDWNQKPIGSLQVNSTPTGARVSVDGKLRGQTPLTLDDLAAGPHTVLIDSTEGTVRRKVMVTEGATETLTESIYPGWLHVSTTIDVTVLDGGKPALLDDSNRVLLKPGTHTVRIENRELAFSQTKQVEIEPGGTTRVVIEVPTSTLSVTGSTGAEVFVDGARAGETPLVEFEVALGTHDVMVVDKSGVTRHASVRATTTPVQLDIRFDRP